MDSPTISAAAVDPIAVDAADAAAVGPPLAVGGVAARMVNDCGTKKIYELVPATSIKFHLRVCQ